MKRPLRTFGIGVGVFVLLLAAGCVLDQQLPKSVELAVWKERCAGWQVTGGYFTDDSPEFYSTGESRLIRKGEPLDFGFSYGGTGFVVGSPIGSGSGEPPPPPVAERDTLAVMLLKDTRAEHYRYQIAVVLMER